LMFNETKPGIAKHYPALELGTQMHSAAVRCPALTQFAAACCLTGFTPPEHDCPPQHGCCAKRCDPVTQPRFTQQIQNRCGLRLRTPASQPARPQYLKLQPRVQIGCFATRHSRYKLQEPRHLASCHHDIQRQHSDPSVASGTASFVRQVQVHHCSA